MPSIAVAGTWGHGYDRETNDSWPAQLRDQCQNAPMKHTRSMALAVSLLGLQAAAQQITRVSISTAGEEANGPCYQPAVSSDGRYVAFISTATNLVSGDDNNAADVFLHDRQSGITTRCNPGVNAATFVEMASTLVMSRLDSLGKNEVLSQTGSILGAGRNPTITDWYGPAVWAERNNGVLPLAVSLACSANFPTLTTAQRPSAFSHGANVGIQGVVFDSDDESLVLGDTNGVRDVFAWSEDDIGSGGGNCPGTLYRVSVTATGQEGNGDSWNAKANRRHFSFNPKVVFQSTASNLAQNDANGVSDVFVSLLRQGSLGAIRVSESAGGEEGNGPSYNANIGGNVVAFVSAASNLVPDDTNNCNDIFLHQVGGVGVVRASVNSIGVEANGSSDLPDVSSFGDYIVFQSEATNLVPGDTNGVSDIFFLDRSASQVPPPKLYCTGKVNSCGGIPSLSFSGIPSASASSGFVVSGSGARYAKHGLLLHGPNGPAAIPFAGGYLCVSPQGLRRGPPTPTIAASPGLCDGAFYLDINSFAQGLAGGAPQAFLRVAGQQVNCQWWGRDSIASGSYLSDGIEYVTTP